MQKYSIKIYSRILFRVIKKEKIIYYIRILAFACIIIREGPSHPLVIFDIRILFFFIIGEGNHEYIFIEYFCNFYEMYEGKKNGNWHRIQMGILTSFFKKISLGSHYL